MKQITFSKEIKKAQVIRYSGNFQGVIEKEISQEMFNQRRRLKGVNYYFASGEIVGSYHWASLCKEIYPVDQDEVRKEMQARVGEEELSREEFAKLKEIVLAEMREKAEPKRRYIELVYTGEYVFVFSKSIKDLDLVVQMLGGDATPPIEYLDHTLVKILPKFILYLSLGQYYGHRDLVDSDRRSQVDMELKKSYHDFLKGFENAGFEVVPKGATVNVHSFKKVVFKTDSIRIDQDIADDMARLCPLDILNEVNKISVEIPGSDSYDSQITFNDKGQVFMDKTIKFKTKIYDKLGNRNDVEFEHDFVASMEFLEKTWKKILTHFHENKLFEAALKDFYKAFLR